MQPAVKKNTLDQYISQGTSARLMASSVTMINDAKKPSNILAWNENLNHLQSYFYFPSTDSSWDSICFTQQTKQEHFHGRKTALIMATLNYFHFYHNSLHKQWYYLKIIQECCQPIDLAWVKLIKHIKLLKLIKSHSCKKENRSTKDIKYVP